VNAWAQGAALAVLGGVVLGVSSGVPGRALTWVRGALRGRDEKVVGATLRAAGLDRKFRDDPFEGVIDGIRVTVDPPSRDRPGYLIRASLGTGLRSEATSLRIERAPKVGETARAGDTGDREFDGRLTIEAADEVAPAILHRDARRALRAAAELDGFVVHDGVAAIGPLFDLREVVAACEAVASVVRTVSLDLSLDEQLAVVARDATEPGLLRARALGALSMCFASTDVAQDAAEQCCDDRQGDVRLPACLLRARVDPAPLVELVLDREVAAAYRLVALHEAAPAGHVGGPAIQRLLMDDDAQLLAQAARLVGERRDERFLARVRELVEHRGIAGSAAARALAQMRDTASLARLLEVLRDDDVAAEQFAQVAAAVAELGGVAEVALLRAIPLSRAAFAKRKALDAAVEAILVRVGNPDLGRLTVVDESGEGGELSVVDPKG
jgi:hypothetical protein